MLHWVKSSSFYKNIKFSPPPVMNSDWGRCPARGGGGADLSGLISIPEVTVTSKVTVTFLNTSKCLRQHF